MVKLVYKNLTYKNTWGRGQEEVTFQDDNSVLLISSVILLLIKLNLICAGLLILGYLSCEWSQIKS